MMALDKVQHEIGDNATCVVILCDRGERYLDTIYSDAWVEQHFGDIAHLWEADRYEREEQAYDLG